MFDFFWKLVSHDLGIDLGTANTFVYVKDKGIVIREPSVVARNRESKKILAIGTEAKKMVGKTPDRIEAVRPLADGVIADFDACLAMLSYYIRLVHQSPGFIPKIPRPKVVIGVPSGITEVEARAVQDAALSAGARQAHLIEEPMAAAIGIGLPIEDPSGQLLIDIGGGTTEIAVISLGGIVVERCLRVAGDEMDEAIVNFARLKHGLILGTSTAEEIKINIGSARQMKKEKMFVARGRDLESGLPRSLKITSSEVREALAPIIQQIITSVTDTIEETPPELLADILKHGIVMAGGASQIQGLDNLISENAKMPVWLADDPLTCVVRGCGQLLVNDKLLKRIRIQIK
ncbi:rod shape-determining protein [Candidatus Beckwithbacteria bacterium CG10_big_fil_rev_8_21_14_0_10_34_10]|uniref:Cell shape-determining protein MreB n=1 Tax=Candidatus Beckwithbacteria bacterium CG10_big_fil_rev_8_21_14_0_10_34_10 TaxID=1974495 RepID=A0A2H0WC22_9BACT|nr:MAG: rod shape-determining protein [Candidatus Beckwithbacteria bacterium CG10_big_fil_rev_8_21_14_0_10_34_10]